LFTRYQPQVIFHAAAHKHVYMMERQPAEAIRNNATVHVRSPGSRRSTGGGVRFHLHRQGHQPTSLMGASKRLAELHLQAIAGRNGGRKTGENARTQERETGSGSGRQSDSEAGEKAETLKAERLKIDGDPNGRAAVLGAQNSEPKTQNLDRISSPQATKFMAVRFGNVLGSSGSVVPISSGKLRMAVP